MSLAALLIAVATPAALGNPALEARADALEMEIRCVQCQNEPIAQSTADIAGDMTDARGRSMRVSAFSLYKIP